MKIALERVAILGGAGAGKSTLARAVGAKLGLPVIHLDRMVYGPNWTKLAPEAARGRLIAALDSGRWVSDGSYPMFADLTIAKADLLVWIEQPVWKRLWRAWRKTRIHKGKPRADRPDDCEEAFGWHSMWTVIRFGHLSRAMEKRLRVATPGRVVRLTGNRAVKRFVKTVA